MPAVTFKKSTAQSSQNCGVRIARAAVTLPVMTNGLRCSARGERRGRQPGRGTRTENTPNIMNAKYSTPITTNVAATPVDVGVRNLAMSSVESGDAIIAPPPNPMMAMPVAIPGRSGNQRINVVTGEM